MKIGILGGGQLGRMFLQAAISYPYQTKVLDPSPEAPCAHLCDEFVVGDFADEQTVLDFAADCDVVGIEIEHVSVTALRQLQAQGKRVIPSPDALAMIQDKGLQKQFYADHDIPTAPFYLIENAAQVDLAKIPLPFVQKTRTGGYDGRGVQIIDSESELAKLWDVPSVIEACCPIEKEIAALVVVDKRGDFVTYPLVEMVFDPLLNLVDVVEMPAELSEAVRAQAEVIVHKLAGVMNSPGVFAVELFVSEDQQVWVNETASRVHNSGHLTIEACSCSQFDQMWRVLADTPLAAANTRRCAAMVNLIGGEGSGEALLPDLDKLLAMPEVYVHWYGKSETRPGRKMGHVTILAESAAELDRRVEEVKPFLRVVAK